MKLFSIIAACGAGVLLSPEQNEGAQKKIEHEAKVDPEMKLRALVAGLGATDYSERGQAMKDLWMMADSALPELQRLIEGDDPELQARARDLRRQILSGILPDTPREIVAILKKFNKAKGDQRLNVFNELYAAKAYDYLFRLMRVEEDPSLLAQMHKSMEINLPTIVRASLVEGKWDEARGYLERWHSPANDRNLAALLQTRGLLDGELKRLSGSKKPEDRTRYLAFLQVKGDPRAVFEEASSQNNARVRNAAAILLGNPAPALRSAMDEQNINQRRYLKIVLARLAGDEKMAAELRTELLEAAEAKGELRDQARAVFYRLGNLEDVEYLMEDDEEAQKTYYFAMEKPLLALEAAGITDGKVDEEWLQKKCKKMVEGVIQNEEESASAELKTLAGFYENHGEIEAAAQVVEAYAKSFMGKNQDDYMAAYTADFLFYSPRAFCLALGRLYAGEKKREEGQRIMGMIFNNHNVDSELLSWTFQTVQTVQPKSSLSEQALISLSCASEQCYVDLLERNRVLAEIEKTALADVKKGVFGNMRNLMRIAVLRNDSESLMRIGAILQENGDKDWGYTLTLNNAFWGRWQKALGEWTEYVKRGKGYENWPPYLYLSGLLEERGGDAATAEKSMKKAQLLGLNERDYRASVLSYLSNFGGDDEEQYRLLKRHFLSQTDEVESNGSSLALLFQEATKRHDWSVVEAAGEVFLAQMGTGNEEVLALQIRYGTDIARGFLLYDQGKIEEAEKTIEAAHDLLPGSGLHADELFLELRKRGMLTLHDRLFGESYQRVMDVLKNFPQSDNDKNTAAWLASRALLELDESEVLIKEALQVFPQNSAYLDTMAELQFAKGNREKALEWSLKSLEAEVSDLALRGQYERYKNAPFPSRKVKKAQ